MRRIEIMTLLNGNPNLQNLINEQLKDSELKFIIDLLNDFKNIKGSKITKLLENYVFRDQVLCKFIVRKSGVHYLICIPKHMRFDILYQYHDFNCSAHLGIKRTLNKTKNRFYWPNINEFVELYIKSCKLCQMRKRSKQRPVSLMQPIIVGHVFEQLAIDHVGKLPKSNGFQYIIVLTDTFSKYAVCKPVAKSNAKTVAKFLFEDIICTFARIPQKLLSDCNQAFLGKVVIHLNILMGIKQLKTSGYRAQVNSITERYNGTLVECLSIFVNEKLNDWSKYVKPVTYAYNSTIQSSTKLSPVEVLFGIKPNFPPDLNLQLSQIKSTSNEYSLGLA
jgi:hypothetical protein